MEPQVIYDMPEQEYHDSTGIGEGKFISRSMVKTYEESPRGFYERYIAKEPAAQFKGSASTAFGSLVEALIIGEDWYEMFYIKCLKKEDEERFKANKIHEANGLIEITQEQLDKAKLTIKGMEYDARGLQLMTLMPEAKHGVVVRWEEETTGLPMQVRYDTIFPNVGIVDWKTTKDNPEKFCSAAYDYGYNLQHLMYQNAWRIATGEELGFYFPVFQNQFPFEFSFIELPMDMLHDAKYCYDKAIVGIKEMVSSGKMPIRKSLEATTPEIPAFVAWKFKHTGSTPLE
jgi:hypothetical protein